MAACGYRLSPSPGGRTAHSRAGGVAAVTKVREEWDWMQLCYVRSMSEVPSRELRNSTADVLRRVAAGEDVVITVNGRGVARLLPIQPQRRRWIDRAELARRLGVAQADPGLRDDLAELAGDTTDDLGPVS